MRAASIKDQSEELLGSSIVDDRTRSVITDGRSVRLSKKECALLALLRQRRGQALTREQLIAGVWGKAYRGTRRTVDVYVHRLRSKLKEGLALETKRGLGYCLDRRSLPGEVAGRSGAP